MKSIPCYLLLVSVCKNAEIYDNLIATVGFYPSRAREGGQNSFCVVEFIIEEIEDERLKRKIILVVRG